MGAAAKDRHCWRPLPWPQGSLWGNGVDAVPRRETAGTVEEKEATVKENKHQGNLSFPLYIVTVTLTLTLALGVFLLVILFMGVW